MDYILSHVGGHLMLMHLLHEVRQILASLRTHTPNRASRRIRARVLAGAELLTLLVYLTLAASIAETLVNSARDGNVRSHQTARPEHATVVA